MKTVKNNTIRAKKRYGQNFLIDDHVLNKIAEGAELHDSDYVLEIGPGLGALTKVLAENCKKVVAVEIDKTLIPILTDTFKNTPNITFIQKDILKTDLDAEIAPLFSNESVVNIKVVANLPYYITTPIIMKLLETRYTKINIELITVMVQKEVADRLMATEADKDYGALSVSARYYTNILHVVNAPPHCFSPQPKVTSTVVTLKVHKEKPVVPKSEEVFFQLIKASFSQRRKTLLNCINHFFYISKSDIEAMLTGLGYDAKVRGETLSIKDFAKIADYMSETLAICGTDHK